MLLAIALGVAHHLLREGDELIELAFLAGGGVELLAGIDRDLAVMMHLYVLLPRQGS